MDLSPTTRALVAEAAVTSLRALPEHLAAADVLYALGQMRAPLAACPPPLQVSKGISWPLRRVSQRTFLLILIVIAPHISCCLHSSL